MYTNGIERVLRTIDPGARPAGRVAFPPGLVEGGARQRTIEYANLQALWADVLAQDLCELKRCLLAERRKFFPLVASPQRSELFSHEPAPGAPR